MSKEEAKKEEKMMRAVIIEKFGEKPTIQMVPIPKPRSGQVLIKVEATPINPSDLTFLAGKYASKRPMPAIVGFEGSGTVIKSGGGIWAWQLKGKRVAFYTKDNLGGSWAEYCVTDAFQCIPLDKNTTFENGACAFVNPLTCLGMWESVIKEQHVSVIQTAACSALGRMIQRYFTERGVRVINIIRRKEQEAMLKKDGAEFILNSNDSDFEERLEKLSKMLNATCCFDAVGGDLAEKIINAIPPNSKYYVYGNLSKTQFILPRTSLMVKQIEIKGFWAVSYLRSKGIISLFLLSKELASLLNTTLKSDIAKTFGLEDVTDAIEYYDKNMSLGKVLLKPSQMSNIFPVIKEEPLKKETKK